MEKVILGVTGSIATGKSFVAKLLQKVGASVFDSDLEVKDIIEKDQEVIKKIAQNFPHTIEHGRVNRQHLRHLVFANKEKLKILEQIIHPLIENRIKIFIQNNNGIVVLEVPLLYEVEYDKYCDYVIVTICDQQHQQERLKDRGLFDLELIEKIRAVQLKDEEKMRRADFVINTSFNEENVMIQIQNILSRIGI